ncbi:MAG: response regulator [Chitinophagaceae bacterium]
MEHTAKIKILEDKLALERKARKAAEAALRSKNGQPKGLSQVVGKKVSSQPRLTEIDAQQKLLEANTVIEETAKAKKIFLENMSHEIRIPMHGILGIAGLLAKTSLSERQHNYLKLIKDAASNLLVIVNDVLDLEKIVNGKLKLEKIPFKIVDKMSITVQSFIYQAEEKGLGVIFQNAIPGDLVVLGDPFRLSQVLSNILSNALKFTEQGSIIITICLQLAASDVLVIECSVKDTGVGMSPQILSGIFESTLQHNSTILRKYGGKGLGLSICKNLLELQDGALSIQSQENQGSTVTFKVPFSISEEKIPEIELPMEVNYLGLGKKKVLVAEEEGLNHFITKHIMESWGFEVDMATGGKQALIMLQREQYDLVLLDIQMTEMDGIAATRRIRRMKDADKASIPIIGLTTHGLKNDSELYLSAGMSDYLSKPFSEAKLFQVITRNLIHNKKNSSNMETNKAYQSEPIPFPVLYDLAMINEVSGGDDDFVKKMVALFIETVPQNLKDLNNYMDSGDWDMVSKMAHKLKSTIDSMGIHSLNQDVRTVEHTAKKKESLENIPSLVHNMNIIIMQCIKQLDAAIMQPVRS